MTGKFHLLGLAIVTLGGAVSAFAQANASVVRANSWEIGAFAGVTYGGTGVSTSGSSNETRAMGGGNITYALNRIVLPYFEYSYFPGIPRETTINGRNVSYAIPLSDFHGGVHIRMPIFREKPFVPYLAIGVGGLHSNDFTAYIKGDLGDIPQQIAARTDFAVNGGGGIRYYIGQHFGLRVEAKVYKPTGDYSNAFGKVEGGFFFQLR